MPGAAPGSRWSEPEVRAAFGLVAVGVEFCLGGDCTWSSGFCRAVWVTARGARDTKPHTACCPSVCAALPFGTCPQGSPRADPTVPEAKCCSLSPYAGGHHLQSSHPPQIQPGLGVSTAATRGCRGTAWLGSQGVRRSGGWEPSAHSRAGGGLVRSAGWPRTAVQG